MAIDHAYSTDTIPASVTALYTIHIVKLNLPVLYASPDCYADHNHLRLRNVHPLTRRHLTTLLSRPL